MKSPSPISKKVPIKNATKTDDIRELYLRVLEQNRLLKELSMQQQIELPFGVADTQY